MKPKYAFLNRDLQSFEIRFKFELAVPIRLDSKAMGRFKNFESAMPAYCSS